MVVLAEEPADFHARLAHVLQENVEVLDAPARVAPDHLEAHLAKIYPRSAAPLARRLREKLEAARGFAAVSQCELIKIGRQVASPLDPRARHGDRLEVQLLAPRTQLPGVRLQAQPRGVRRRAPGDVEQDVSARSVDVETLSVHVDQVRVAGRLHCGTGRGAGRRPAICLDPDRALHRERFVWPDRRSGAYVVIVRFRGAKTDGIVDSVNAALVVEESAESHSGLII
mmetsp:Transcript_22487/g.63870  ORF Transcript_22487/g.63870 Transcript_22487/m.63870 type:complete len:227 (+) Transcript_22487:446-1126(+)